MDKTTGYKAMSTYTVCRSYGEAVLVKCANEGTNLSQTAQSCREEAGFQSPLFRAESGVTVPKSMRLYQLASSPVVWFA